MNPSKYQQSIIEWAKFGTGHGCCNAVAGSGKSTTLRLTGLALQEAGYSPYDIKIIVFGKANSLDLIAKFGKAWESSISTLHSAGWNLLKQHLNIRNTKGLVQDKKYKKIGQSLGLLALRRGDKGDLKQRGYIDKDEDFLKLIALLRLTNKKPTAEEIRDICHHFELPDIRVFPQIAHAAERVLAIGEGDSERGRSFDFTDMIWLPVKWNLNHERWFKPYKFVLVDECQDLNAAQLELALSLAGNNGRILAVGDPRQAIFGFAGADNRSYEKIVQRLNATELPLSTCYRCPKSHIELVNSIFPEIPIEAFENAIEGSIESVTEKDLWDSDKPCRLASGDMVVCRKTAPLVTLCIRLIARGIAATVKGRAIGDMIKSDLEEISKMPGFSYERFNDAVGFYRQAKAARYAGLDNEEQLLEALDDKLESLSAIYESQPQATCVRHLEDYIDSLFSDDHSPITLCTCHRAKGLEAERVFVIEPDKLPLTWRNQQDWQAEQEDNLLYVTLTRSKRDLFVVGNKPHWLPKSEQEEKPEVNSETVNTLQSIEQTQDAQVDTVNTLQSNIEVEAQEEPETIPVTVNSTVNSPQQEKVRDCLIDPQWQNKSDRAIAEFCGVSPPIVGKVRRRLIAAGELNEAGERFDKHGRLLKTDNIGTKGKTPIEQILEIAKDLPANEIKQVIKELERLIF